MDRDERRDGEDTRTQGEAPGGLKDVCRRAWLKSGWASMDEADAARADLSYGERKGPDLVRLFRKWVGR